MKDGALRRRALPWPNGHAPNEWFPEENIEMGIRALAYLYEELA
jgi:acetylornithine deacetylase/succinyl-diaminopimelate desuccinylase-like protein